MFLFRSQYFLVLTGGFPAMSAELVLLVISTAGAGVAAVFAILCFLRTQQSPAALAAQGATQILRGETDIVRAAVEDQARGLRQELG
jgi:hypothetical protein